MLRKTSLSVLALTFLCSFALLPQDDTLEWENNYKAALEEARRSNKPIFLEYRCEP